MHAAQEAQPRPSSTSNIRMSQRHLRSTSSPLLIVGRTRLSAIGDRALLVAAARVWNTVHRITSSLHHHALPVFVFRSRPKTQALLSFCDSIPSFVVPEM